jgi:1-deoxy-D-xylulose-5-phosphate reductoisomerase
MARTLTQVAVFGSTGSVGASALEVVSELADRLQVVALSAHSRFAQLVDQARQYSPRWLVASDAEGALAFDWSRLPSATTLLTGQDALARVARAEEVEIVVAAIVGSAGVRSTWAALEAGKRVALANKETMVVAGPLIQELVSNSDAELIPVDSEHSAIFQALKAGRPAEVARVILTASGGPLRDWTKEQLENVSINDALDHPVWDMGRKITIDSATMMNKALEVIEARWLFGLQPDQIAVLIHPQSIVHSMVEFVDGSVIAQMSYPDMKLPIQYALTYPERCPSAAIRFDLTQPMQLEFKPPDLDRFPALELGMEVARVGGTAGAVVNAANEAAVQGFLDGQLSFLEIVPICRSVLASHEFDTQPSLDRLLELDRWAREEVFKWVCT